MLMRTFIELCLLWEPWLPKWDEALVLMSLTWTPFQPLSCSSDRDLMLTTAFLIALASVKRLRELHGLPYLVQHSGGWGSFLFSF